VSGPVRPRPRPCPSCPYRRDCPSGVWAAATYDILPKYDGGTAEQAAKGAFGVFGCHQGDGQLCAGWCHVHGDDENLALRLAASLDPDVDVPAVLAYVTGVPLFASGAEAAEHGKRDIEDPSPEARQVAEKIARVRAVRGAPVQLPGDEDPPPPAAPARRRR
jgi:hypothetical protein